MEADEKKCPRCAETVKTDAQVCRFCSYDFATGQVSGPVPVKKRRRGLGCLVVIITMLGIATCTTKLAQPGSRLASSPFGVDTQMQKIKDKVADDAVKQYDIAAQGGTAIDRCVQAGMVAAAYLQAQDQPSYDSWKSTEKTDCAAAGIKR